MLLLKYLLLSAGIAMFVIAAGILSYDAYLLIAWQRRGLKFDPEKGTPAPGLSPILRSCVGTDAFVRPARAERGGYGTVQSIPPSAELRSAGRTNASAPT